MPCLCAAGAIVPRYIVLGNKCFIYIPSEILKHPGRGISFELIFRIGTYSERYQGGGWVPGAKIERYYSKPSRGLWITRVKIETY